MLVLPDFLFPSVMHHESGNTVAGKNYDEGIMQRAISVIQRKCGLLIRGECVFTARRDTERKGGG